MNSSVAANRYANKTYDDEARQIREKRGKKARLTVAQKWICWVLLWLTVGRNGKMLLTGTFERSVDEKLRIAIPKPLRDALPAEATALYVAPGTDGSLALYTEDAFSELAQRLRAVSPTAGDVRSFSRLFFARAQRVEVDSQSRVRIPAELAAMAGIENSAVLVGAGSHLELWDKGRWSTYLAQAEPRYDEIAERAFEPPHGSASHVDPTATIRPQFPR